MQSVYGLKEKQILVAEPRDILRIGLRNIFVEDPRVFAVHEAATIEQLIHYLNNSSLDLLIVHQSLVTDITLFPQGKLVILVTEPDIQMLLIAYEHKVLGYLSDNVSTKLLLMMLDHTDESCLLDPTLMPWIVRYLAEKSFPDASEYEYLSPREREIFDLLHQGIDRRTIARQLGISESTLKTHVKNIAMKRDMTLRTKKDIAK